MNAVPIRVVVVDDEKPARERVRRLLSADARVQVAGCCGGGAEAVRLVAEAADRDEPVHLLFLDVQMPELDGFAVVNALMRQCEPAELPAIVFVTAHDEYALRAFEAHAIDYLLKPFSDERFQAALDRAVWHCRAGQAHATLEQMKSLLGALASPLLDRAGATPNIAGSLGGDARQPSDVDAAAPGALAAFASPPTSSTPPAPTAPLDRIVLKTADRVRLLPVQQITWIEAAGMYVRLHMRDGAVHLHRSLLGDLDAALDPRRFVRIHRSTIVNIDVIDELQQDVHGDYIVVLKDRTEVRLGRRYRDRLQQRLGQSL